MESNVIELGSYRLRRRLHARTQSGARPRQFIWIGSALAPAQIVDFPLASGRAQRDDARSIPR